MRTNELERTLTALVIATLACGPQEATPRMSRETQAPPLRAESSALGVSVVPTSTERQALAVQQPRLAPPRRPFDGELRLVWERGGTADDSLLLLPTDLHFSLHGLLVYDAGARRIRVFDASTGSFKYSAGGEGSGPGEFTLALGFHGTAKRPVAMDRTQRRLTLLIGLPDQLVSAPIPNRPWMSTCALDSERTFGAVRANDRPIRRADGGEGTVASRSDFLTAVGDRVIDSMSTPFPELVDVRFLARQAIVRQLDDSTCAILIAYQSHFATLGSRDSLRRGTFVESSGIVNAVEEVLDANGSTRISLPRGARIGPRDARGWRASVLVLFSGRTPLARRLLDVYRASDLAYQGSIVLPARATGIAVSGDTLAVIAERDDYPQLSVFILSRSGR